MDGPAAAVYREMVEAAGRQRAKLRVAKDLRTRWNVSAPAFRFDPLRPLEPNLEIIASYVGTSETVVDVGGGAGRIALPLARRCAHVTNVEPSAGMGQQFLASAGDSGIDNVTLLPESWPTKLETTADVAVTEDVTYFVSDIVPFIAGLSATARRLVLISIWSVPPPNRNDALFELVYGEAQAPVPGHRELLPVLWEMGILPDIRVLPESFTWPESRPSSRDEAVNFALDAVEAAVTEKRLERVSDALPELFDELDGTLAPRWRTDGQGLLIMWETRR